ncbi:MAG: nuclear transport factor 2 family protein [Acidobacteria bacterium]|nr:nuclear transport factor 2 family protein [Acidobacteriota bacterium]MBI3487515.1 nuclear transport factor 2 family protein [Acidobacteriota bacterium]
MNMPKHLLVSSAFGATLLGFTLLHISCAHERTGVELKTVTAMLKQQADRWDQDIIKKDLSAIAKNMSEDFRHISNKGAISNKETFLQEIVSPDLVIHPYTVEDFDIRVYGNCALLCGRTKMTGSYKGNPFQSYYRYVDTYTLSNGQWKVCNVQITNIPE